VIDYSRIDNSLDAFSFRYSLYLSIIYYLMKIRIIVDPDLCIGAASCVTIAPETFALNDENKADVLDHGQAPDGPSYEREVEVTEDEFEKIIMGAQSCPTLAIAIIDEAGNQLYPEA